jgi:Beta-propeller repeat
MKGMRRYLAVFAILCIASVAMLRYSHQIQRSDTKAAAQPVVLHAFGKLPLAFEANQGQTDPEVQFISRGSGYTLFLTAGDAILFLRKGQSNTLLSFPKQGPAVLQMQVIGSNSAAKVTGTNELEGRSNYFLGNDPKKWHTNVTNYGKVRYSDVYPGIDLVYYGNQGKLEYDFVVWPGTDPSVIRLATNRAEALYLDAAGNLVAELPTGNVVLHKPDIYQTRSGSAVRETVEGRFILTAGNNIGFQVGTYDRSRPLVIDPALVYSTFLGGTGDEDATATGPNANGPPIIALDSLGNAYVAGTTVSADFPTTPGAFQRSLAGDTQCDPSGTCPEVADVFVTKLNSKGTAIVYSTYLGGSALDSAAGIVVDGSGNAYVAGSTRSANFPVTHGAFQTSYSGFTADCNQYFTCGDGFVTKINATGSALLYSTYLGGTENDAPSGIALDAGRNIYISGTTDSADFPTTPGSLQPTFIYVDCGIGPAGRDRACEHGFVTKLNPFGTRLVYSTYLGGSGEDANGIAVDRFGNAHVIGSTSSFDFPVTQGAYQPQMNPGLCPWGWYCPDAFFSKLDATGAKLLYSTFFGGSGWEDGRKIALDPYGNTYISGATASPDFAVSPGTFQTTFGGGICNEWFSPYCADAFVAKLNTSKQGTASLVYSTYIGGDGDDNPWGGPPIAIDQWGDAHIAGFTWSANFPLVNPLQSSGFNPPNDVDAYVVKLNSAGTGAIYSTYLGGNSWEEIDGLALDSAGNLYLSGMVNSSDFPVSARAFQKSFAGGIVGLDAIVAKISPSNSPSAVPYPKELQFGDVAIGNSSDPQTITLRNVGSGTLKFGLISTNYPKVFHQSNDCQPQVLGAGSCNVTITFAPKTTGQINGSLVIYDNTQDSPQFVALHGNGVQP